MRFGMYAPYLGNTAQVSANEPAAAPGIMKDTDQTQDKLRFAIVSRAGESTATLTIHDTDYSLTRPVIELSLQRADFIVLRDVLNRALQ